MSFLMPISSLGDVSRYCSSVDAWFFDRHDFFIDFLGNFSADKNMALLSSSRFLSRVFFIGVLKKFVGEGYKFLLFAKLPIFYTNIGVKGFDYVVVEDPMFFASDRIEVLRKFVDDNSNIIVLVQSLDELDIFKSSLGFDVEFDVIKVEDVVDLGYVERFFSKILPLSSDIINKIISLAGDSIDGVIRLFLAVSLGEFPKDFLSFKNLGEAVYEFLKNFLEGENLALFLAKLFVGSNLRGNLLPIDLFKESWDIFKGLRFIAYTTYFGSSVEINKILVDELIKLSDLDLNEFEKRALKELKDFVSQNPLFKEIFDLNRDYFDSVLKKDVRIVLKRSRLADKLRKFIELNKIKGGWGFGPIKVSWGEEIERFHYNRKKILFSWSDTLNDLGNTLDKLENLVKREPFFSIIQFKSAASNLPYHTTVFSPIEYRFSRIHNKLFYDVYDALEKIKDEINIVISSFKSGGELHLLKNIDKGKFPSRTRFGAYQLRVLTKLLDEYGVNEFNDLLKIYINSIRRVLEIFKRLIFLMKKMEDKVEELDLPKALKRSLEDLDGNKYIAKKMIEVLDTILTFLRKIREELGEEESIGELLNSLNKLQEELKKIKKMYKGRDTSRVPEALINLLEGILNILFFAK